MSYSVRVNLKMPQLWSARDSLITGADTVAMIRHRTYQGKSSEGVAFKPYSTKALYVAFKGARLKPKGGRLSRTKKSRFYAGGPGGGYGFYKRASRRGVQGASVDLTLSGSLMNNLGVLRADSKGFIVGLYAPARSYGYYVHENRPFIGLTDKDKSTLNRAIEIRLRRKMLK